MIQVLQIFRQGIQLPVPGESIDGNVHPCPSSFTESGGLFQLVQGEIVRGSAHTEALARQIDGVGPIGQGEAQPFHVPRGGQKLGSLHHWLLAATLATARLCSSRVRLKMWLPSVSAT